MKIIGSQIQNVLGAYLKTTRRADVTPGGPVAPTDEVTLSGRATEIARARQAYEQLPEVREDRVAELQARLRQGTYRLENADIAAAIMGEPREGQP